MLRIIAWIAGILGGILLLLLVLLLLLLLVLLILLLPRVRVEVDKIPAHPLRLVLGYGIVRIPILPRPKKGKEPREKPEPPPKKAEKPKEKKKPPFSLKGGDIGDAICLALDLLLDLKDRLVIHRLRVKVLIAAGDAAKTGILLGRSAAMTGMILPILEQNFVISDFAIDVDGDFQAEEPATRAAVGVTVSLRPLHLPLLLLKYARRIFALVRALLSGRKKAEGPVTDGENPVNDTKKENVT